MADIRTFKGRKDALDPPKGLTPEERVEWSRTLRNLLQVGTHSRVTPRAMGRYVKRSVRSRVLHIDAASIDRLIQKLRPLAKHLKGSDSAVVSAAIRQLDKLWLANMEESRRLSRTLSRTLHAWRMTPVSRLPEEH